MLVGGNIDHVTRVMTMAIAMETGKGDPVLALGLVLIAISLGVDTLVFGVGTTRMGRAWQ